MRRFLMLLCTLALGCGDAPEEPDAGPLLVYTSFYPSTDFARRIGGDAVEVVCPLPEGADPALWEPSPEVLARLQAADLIVLNGAGFEGWVKTRSLPASKVVSCAAGFEDQWLQYEHTVQHSHGAEGAHVHTGTDGHTWLDPQLAKRMAEAISAALCRRLPEQSAALQARCAELTAGLDSLDLALHALEPLLQARALWANHPAYNYLARRYGWRLTSFDIDPEQPLSPALLSELSSKAASEPPAALLFEAEPGAELAAALHAHGIRWVVFAPLEAVAADEQPAGGFLTLMRRNVEALRGVLQDG